MPSPSDPPWQLRLNKLASDCARHGSEQKERRHRDTGQLATAVPHRDHLSGGRGSLRVARRRYFGDEHRGTRLRIALAQIDPTVGAVDANAAKVAEWIGRARGEGAELVIFPELCIPGYPAEDLYLKRHFIAATHPP